MGNCVPRSDERRTETDRIINCPEHSDPCGLHRFQRYGSDETANLPSGAHRQRPLQPTRPPNRSRSSWKDSRSETVSQYSQRGLPEAGGKSTKRELPPSASPRILRMQAGTPTTIRRESRKVDSERNFMQIERLSSNALVFHACSSGSGTPNNPCALNPTDGFVWQSSGTPQIPRNGTVSRFTSEDVAEEAILEPQGKRVPVSTISGAAYGWRQRRRLRSRSFCR